MFDLRRFLLLARVHWAERGRGYLWFLGIGVLVHICVWLLVSQAALVPYHYRNDLQSVIYLAGFVLTSLLFAGLEFSPLRRREAALSWLMRPATALEKFLLAFLIVALLYPLAYTLAFQICNLPGAWLAEIAARAKAEADPSFRFDAEDYAPYFPFLDPSARAFEASFLLCVNALQALVIAGSLRFRRLAGIKTLVALFVLVFIALPLVAMLASSNVSTLFPAGRLPPDAAGLRAWRWVLWIGVPGLFWASAYAYLRDRELH